MENQFASLKLLDSDSDRRLTKSSSYSNLLSPYQICVEQSYRSENPFGLVKQYSCEQIYKKVTETRQLRVSEVVQTGYAESRNTWHGFVSYADTPVTCTQPYKTKNIMQAPKFTAKQSFNDIEFMEVENLQSAKEYEPSLKCPILDTNALNIKQKNCTGLQEVETIDAKNKETIETEEKDENTCTDVKKKPRLLKANIKAPKKKERNMLCFNLIGLCLLPIAIGIIVLLFNPVTYNMCHRGYIFTNVTNELQQKVYGQKQAISSLTNALNYDIHHLKIICLIGGTGVGKSYTAEIISKNVPLIGRTFVYDLALEQTVDTNVLNSFDSYSLLILENLKMRDLEFFINIVNLLKRSNDKCITVFAIINVEQVNDSLEREVDLISSTDRIISSLKGSKVDITVIPYEPMSEQALEMCIMEAALFSDLQLTSTQVHRIKESLLYSGSGCKGAYAKVQVIGREQSLW